VTGSPITLLWGDLGRAESDWSSQGHTSYRMTVSVKCRCAANTVEPLIALVRDGSVESLTSATTGTPAAESVDRSLFTVPGIFVFLSDAIRAADVGAGSFGAIGVPQRVSLGSADPEIGAVSVEVSDYQPLRG
jgi:hypothetical protein